MNRVLNELQPRLIWSYFEDICQVPRPSKKEEQIIAFLESWAVKHNLNFKKDAIGNVLISKGASPGFENRKKVILQSHMDMVCEKHSNIEHDFEKDPIKPRIVDGWVKASGTTLGADCGIGMAASMAVLTDDTIKHGPIEALFTVDEETGLTGAFNLQEGFFDGEILLNLDSEDEGELFIGCAGGVDTIATFPFKKMPIEAGLFPLEIMVTGLLGGHSGDDINKGRGSANQILVRFLWKMYQKYGIELAYIDGGNLRNAIAREAKAVILVKPNLKEELVADFNVYKSEIVDEIGIVEKNIQLQIGSADLPKFKIEAETTQRLLSSLAICPHGVYRMSLSMPGLVETSTNLASIKVLDDEILVTTSQRSDKESRKDEISTIVATVFKMAGASVVHSDGYPGWSPNVNSEILKITESTYKLCFGKAPMVRSIHAGLECGLFLAKYPHLDMVSFGPTIKDAHSPDEKIEIEAVEKFWIHLVSVLEQIPTA